MIAANGNVRDRWTREIKSQRIVVESRAFIQDETRQRPEPLSDTIELSFRISEFDLEALMNVLVEPFEQLAPRVMHPGADALIHFFLKFLEGGFDFFRCPAFLINRKDPL